MLALVGFDETTENPPHGVIERRAGTNEPSGTVREQARDMIDKLRPPRELDTSIFAMRNAMQRMNAHGITSVYDVWIGEHEMQVYQALEQSGDLTVRVLGAIVDEGNFEKHVGEDLERVLRLLGGERKKAHAAAVSVFAYHARRRGYRTEVIPEVEGPAEPDVLIVKDGEKAYVEVEAGRDKEAKWRNEARLQGFVAVCAVKQAGQDALVEEIKALGIPGRATHIERLAKDKTNQVSLWAEEWA